MYYQRIDVKNAVCGYSTSSKSYGVREGAFFNARKKTFQRYTETIDGKKPVELTPSEVSKAAEAGAIAFYCSYWLYDCNDFREPTGRDLVWVIRIEKGDLEFAKKLTRAAAEALWEAGAEPFVKYSGDLGFDIILPLESIPFEVWHGNIDALDDLQGELSDVIVSSIRSRLGLVVEGDRHSFKIKEDEKTSLLSELRVKRGLLLAPMSINPETGLVSVPVDPRELDNFTIFDASPSKVIGKIWRFGSGPSYGLIKYAKLGQVRSLEDNQSEEQAF
ncbi:MAG: hypothetical protein QXG10_01040 [Candidatus Hadarchaeales archaeon]